MPFSPSFWPSSTGLYFNLKGVVYLPGDTVFITDIGIDIIVDPNPCV